MCCIHVHVSMKTTNSYCTNSHWMKGKLQCSHFAPTFMMIVLWLKICNIFFTSIESVVSCDPHPCRELHMCVIHIHIHVESYTYIHVEIMMCDPHPCRELHMCVIHIHVERATRVCAANPCGGFLFTTVPGDRT